jgi:hypothetical protein
MAITGIAGNRERTTESNSNPDMPGMLRSERRISGISVRNSRSAENPSWAHRTRYPISASVSDIDDLIVGSSSTMRSLSLVLGIIHLTNPMKKVQK